MRPIRAFLFACGENGQWECQVFRDFEPLLEASITANVDGRNPVGVHVGFSRPDTDAVQELLSKQVGWVFLSAGALGTMPLPVRARQVAVGTADGFQFYAAMDGFGYRIDESSEEPAGLIQRDEAPGFAHNPVPVGWLAQIVMLDFALGKTLADASIWDDESYLLRERELDMTTRHVVGLRRYEILAGEPPAAASFVSRLRFAPPWLLSAPVEMLCLSVRPANVCNKNGIVTIADFSRYGHQGLYDLRNLGRKSVDEIAKKVVDLFRSGLPLGPRVLGSDSEEHAQRAGGSLVSHGKGHNISDGLVTILGHSQNIGVGFERALQQLNERERLVLACRAGYRCEPMTLQEIGDRLSLTRERVRQIELIVIKKMASFPILDELAFRISKHLQGRSTPLFLDGLSAVDDWFKGSEQLGTTLAWVSDRYPRLTFHMLRLRGLWVVSRVTQSEWDEAVTAGKDFLAVSAKQNLSEHELWSHAATLLLVNGDDMRDALIAELKPLCVWSVTSDGHRILTGVGDSLSNLVSCVLRASATPLHIDEIQHRVQSLEAYDGTGSPNIRGAAGVVGLLYGRSTYGLIEHSPLDPSQMAEIRAEVEDIISAGSPTKQWHSSELCEEFYSRGLSFDGNLTKYLINIALQDAPGMVYLGRLVWSVRGNDKEVAGARIEVRPAIISMLLARGGPMSADEIRTRLIAERGLNVNLQISANSPLIRLGRGLWGLDWRDMDIPQAQFMASQLVAELERRQEGMHVTEVAAFLGPAKQAEVSTLVSIANKDGLRLDKHHYCYLQSWGESRRVSVRDAVAAALQEHSNGLLFAELHDLVEEAIRRKIDRYQVIGVLRNIEADFDVVSGLWRADLARDDEFVPDGYPETQ
jgi:hypothetical protein